MKKVISLICTMAITLSLTSPIALAYNADVESAEILNEYQQQVSDTITYHYIDYLNGDAEIVEIHSGETVRSVFVNRQTNTITKTNFSNGDVFSQEVQHYTPLAWEVDTSEINTYFTWTPVGDVVYNYYSYSGTLLGTHTVDYKYRRSTDQTAVYDLNGEFESLVDLTAFLVGLFSFPNMIASEVAQWATALFGTVVGGTIFFPISVPLQAIRRDVTWSFTDEENSDTYALLTGTEYEITDDNYNGEIFDDGAYYDPLLFNYRDVQFATTVHEYLYGSDRIEVLRWIDAT